jgi:hypothetical protein
MDSNRNLKKGTHLDCLSRPGAVWASFRSTAAAVSSEVCWTAWGGVIAEGAIVLRGAVCSGGQRVVYTCGKRMKPSSQCQCNKNVSVEPRERIDQRGHFAVEGGWSSFNSPSFNKAGASGVPTGTKKWKLAGIHSLHAPPAQILPVLQAPSWSPHPPGAHTVRSAIERCRRGTT